MNDQINFRLVTRSMALVCLLCMLGEFLGLPTDVIGIVHHIHSLRVAKEMDRYVPEETYWIRYYGGLAFGRLVGLVISLMLAQWLYRGGRGVRRFYALERDTTPQNGEHDGHPLP